MSRKVCYKFDSIAMSGGQHPAGRKFQGGCNFYQETKEVSVKVKQPNLILESVY